MPILVLQTGKWTFWVHSRQLSYGLSWEERWIEAKREGLKKQTNKILPVYQAKKKQPTFLFVPPIALVTSVS